MLDNMRRRIKEQAIIPKQVSKTAQKSALEPLYPDSEVSVGCVEIRIWPFRIPGGQGKRCRGLHQASGSAEGIPQHE